MRNIEDEYFNFATSVSNLVNLANTNFSVEEQPSFKNAMMAIEKASLRVEDALEDAVSRAGQVRDIIQSLEQDGKKASANALAQIESAKGRVESLVDDQRARASDAMEKIEDHGNTMLNQLSSQGERTLSELKNKLAAGVAAEQSSHFGEEATYHSGVAVWWLLATIACAAAFIAIAIPGLFECLVSITNPSMIEAFADLSAGEKYTFGAPIPYLASKIVVLGAISFFVGLAAKNFLSHRHNTVLNRHRQNALRTFEALVEAAGDPASRDVILHHAASSMFSPQDTGYGRSGGSATGINVFDAANRAISKSPTSAKN